ncbi:MAG TPA: DNA-binding response regulator [Syntrophus sp. (in: bacteria)]|jgi:DNA-binding NarL/FixJ family response regulator|nr:DNA-binding response regulator [Syntrophus sp. (in: bacteria)]
MPIKVIVVDDHAVIREGLEMLLQSDPDIKVIATCKTGIDAISEIRKLKPDVVVMDISMPDMDGIEATRHLAELELSAKVIILSMHGSTEYVQRALKAGAVGYLLKQSAGMEVIKAVKAVNAGKRYLSEKIADIMFDNYVGKLKPAWREQPLEKLSQRERDVLKLIVEGRSNQTIAELLSISKKTVETYKVRIMNKLDIHDLPSLVKFAIQQGLTSIE